MRPSAYPAVPVAGLFASLLILAAGIFADLGPPSPTGELRPATVISIEQDSIGRPFVALVRVDTPDGAVVCGLRSSQFDGGRLPGLHSDLTVDYWATGCAPAPVSRELPREGILTIGVGGTALMAFWLWAGRRAGL